LKKADDPNAETGEQSSSDRENPRESLEKKDRIKELIKKKLKPVHQEIIAPPGQ